MRLFEAVDEGFGDMPNFQDEIISAARDHVRAHMQSSQLKA